MAVTTTKLTGTPKEWDAEVHNIVFALGADVTTELTTSLSEIYHMEVSPMFGTSAGHTEEDMGLLELDETATSGIVTVSGGAVTINRIATSADGTLAAQSCQVVLYGKSGS